MIKESFTAMNPVTIIALFAALCEGSAATALPFLEEDNQDIYVWFLITFPSALTFMFFLTLNFNHKVLYAPSDFSNEKNFLKAFKKVTTDLKSMTHIDPSQPLDHLRPLPRLLLHSTYPLDVLYGGPVSCRGDIERLLSALDSTYTTTTSAPEHSAKLILLLRKQNKHENDDELISPLRRRAVKSANGETFAILTADSSHFVLL
ncbi:MAG: hypothetical protein ACOH2R_12860 [Pseudomonas sp.]